MICLEGIGGICGLIQYCIFVAHPEEANIELIQPESEEEDDSDLTVVDQGLPEMLQLVLESQERGQLKAVE